VGEKAHGEFLKRKTPWRFVCL